MARLDYQERKVAASIRRNNMAKFPWYGHEAAAEGNSSHEAAHVVVLS